MKTTAKGRRRSLRSRGTRVAMPRGMDFTQYPMGLIGGLVALFVFGVFIGTWWWYGMRAMSARAH